MEKLSQDYSSVFWSTCHLMNTCSGPIRHKVMVELHCLILAANEGVGHLFPALRTDYHQKKTKQKKKGEWKAAYRMQ